MGRGGGEIPEELRMFLDAKSGEEIRRKHDKLYMVLALRAMNPDFDHIHDQVLTHQEVPLMESLLTRLLRVLNPRKNENSLKLTESSAMVSSQGRRRRGGRGNRGCGGRSGGRNGQLYCTHCKMRGHTRDFCYDIVGWHEKITNVSTSETHEPKFPEKEYQEYLRLKSNSQAQSSLSPSTSTTSISHSVDSQEPWVIDLGASNHIFGNSSLFTSLSPPKVLHLITLANDTKVTSKGVVKVSISPSLNLSHQALPYQHSCH